MNFSGKKVGIWGLGVVGSSALRFFLERNAIISVMDAKEPDAATMAWLSSHKIPFILQEQVTPFIQAHDYLLASPGIDIRPYASFKDRFLTELDLFGQHWKKPIIAITGSVGKTTVTHLLSSILSASGKRVVTGGNIGTGMLDLLTHQEDVDLAVLEVSSFQLEWCRSFAPTIALWTNLHPNHLDRHGSLEHYFSAKAAILTRQQRYQTAIVPAELYELVKATGTHSRVIPWSLDRAALGSLSWFSSAYIKDESHISRLTIENDSLNRVEQICDLDQVPPVSFIGNWILIIAALDQLGISFNHHYAQQITVPEHRLERVVTNDRVRWYNDSKSTIPAATLAAVEQLNSSSIILFIGGVSKGVDRAPFIATLAGRIKRLYCFGKEATQLCEVARQSGIDSYEFSTLEQAVSACKSTLKPDDIVLFSPGGASYDLYKNYQERGTHFKQLVIHADHNSV